MLNEPNLFSGLVYCADCGAPMRLFRTRTRAADSYSNYKCGAYSKRGKEACSGHYIRESQLKAIVLDDLRRVTYYARQKEKLLLQYVAQKNTEQVKKEISQIQKEAGRLHRRDIELTALFKRLYEDNVLQRIPDEQYRILSTEYTQEQAELRERLTQLETRQKKLEASATNTARFVERAKQYSEITELTPELLRLFIERIEVGERAAKYSRNAVQDVMIYYRDIGLLDTTEAQDLKDQQAETDPAA